MTTRIVTWEKKCHTVKALALSNPQRHILYFSACWVGTTHDYRMLQEEFPPPENWFQEHSVHVDLGFQGIETDYTGKAFSIPHKKPKKRDRILANRLRMHDLDLYSDELGVCAGLWNFCLTC